MQASPFTTAKDVSGPKEVYSAANYMRCNTSALNPRCNTRVSPTNSLQIRA